MNVLISSAGRRTSLVRAFREAVERRGGRVVAADVDGLAPALFLAHDAVRVPRVKHPDFIPSLLSIVAEHRIGVLVPTIDTELPLLAAAADAFRAIGCEPMISDPRLIEISGDKWQTAAEFQTRGIRVPASWLPEQVDHAALPERLFLKPRDGSASQHTYRASRADLAQVLPRVPNAIIQEEITAPEITIDALLDLQGRPLHYVPRVRIRAVGGESIQGVTLPPDVLGPWIVALLERVGEMGGRGPITLQAFLTEPTPTFSEINPRVGGGFPLTLAAGGNYPEWVLDLAEGKSVPPRLGEYQTGLYMTRHYVEIFTDAPQWA